MKKMLFALFLIACLLAVALALRQKTTVTTIVKKVAPVKTVTLTPTIDFPLAIGNMKAKSYPGSDLKIEQTLSPGSNYANYVVSYESEGLKIYGQLTVPQGKVPAEGWPVILFNHGYIPPNQYSTQTSYSTFISPFASQGYIVFKPDYRGNGNSEGTPTQVYVSPDYITDSMNALASIKKYKDADATKIGLFGHSMGGNIALHQLVMTKDIKAAVLAASVVGSYGDIFAWGDKREQTGVLTTQNDLQTLQLVKQFLKDHGTPTTNPTFYQAIDPIDHISDVSAPIDIVVGTMDQTVPQEFSQSLKDALQKAGKSVEYQQYDGADHNLYPSTSAALTQALTFFNSHLK